ncbi:MAG: hypothetical protein IJ583_12625 [Firmicutes bacterium]|nr:hypothetical protein [Bacillota bacterium]
MDIFWNIFEKSGSIDAFMAHKEYERSYGEMIRKKTENIADDLVTGENLWIR